MHEGEERPSGSIHPCTVVSKVQDKRLLESEKDNVRVENNFVEVRHESYRAWVGLD